ncbi:hypothetical protein CRG98_019970 [Punica granatum]|uniref:Uncharacterized protein n=1 Tax=Punica granatum TaxID=22663 RepID=A0A2I0JUV3_PUNGR|nr:hypothetical protein CRG98_019970 [Punica granatum]
MARLAEVVGRNGTSEGSVCTARGSRDPIALCGWNVMLGTSNGKSKPRNGLKGWEICRLGCLMIFGLSQVGWLPEYRVVFRAILAGFGLGKGWTKLRSGLEVESFLERSCLERV